MLRGELVYKITNAKDYKMKNFFIKCDEATLICDKKQYKEASLWERMKLSYHLLVCKNCRVYPEQNAILTKAYNYKSNIDSKVERHFSDSEKATMKKKLQNNL